MRRRPILPRQWRRWSNLHTVRSVFARRCTGSRLSHPRAHCWFWRRRWTRETICCAQRRGRRAQCSAGRWSHSPRWRCGCLRYRSRRGGSRWHHPLALEAVCVRVVSELQAQSKLGRLAPIADRPGLPRGVAPHLLRARSGCGRCRGRAGRIGRALPTLPSHAREPRASRPLQTCSTPPSRQHWSQRYLRCGVSLCAYDLGPKTRLERRLLEILVQRSSLAFATVASNDLTATTMASLLRAAPRAHFR